MVELAGADATSAFEEIGHSEDARELLKSMFVGDFDGAVISFIFYFFNFIYFLQSQPSIPVTSKTTQPLPSNSYSFYLNFLL